MVACRSVLRTSATALGVFGLVGLGTAHANPAAIVPSAADPGNVADVHVSVDYAYQLDRSLISREHVGAPDADPLGGIPRHKDLKFQQFRHVLTPHAELAVFHDTWVSFAIPIILAQARELELANGVTRDSSSTLQDGLLPLEGFDARDPGTPPPGNLVFRGHDRHGLDQLYIGLAVAPMNQRRDDTKPTWKLGGEVRMSVGRIMKFDAVDPGAQTGVATGVHELRLWTSIDKQYRWTEAWFDMFWQAPIAIKNGSLFEDPGFGSSNTGPGQQAGAGFGLEIYAVNDKTTGNRITLDVGSRIVAHFEGRQYSELWEVFALAGDSRGTGPLILDRNPLEPGLQGMSHPGVSNVENYLETAGRIALRATIGPHVRFAVLADVNWKTDHVITFADAGIDLPTCKGGTTVGCEAETNDLVNPGTREVNPLHVPTIDLVGHRFHSQDNLGVVIGVESQVLF